MLALAPLVVFIFWIGLHPEFFLVADAADARRRWPSRRRQALERHDRAEQGALAVETPPTDEESPTRDRMRPCTC